MFFFAVSICFHVILRFDELRPGEASPVDGFPGAERGKLWRADDEECMEGSDGLREQESLRIFLPEVWNTTVVED